MGERNHEETFQESSLNRLRALSRFWRVTGTGPPSLEGLTLMVDNLELPGLSSLNSFSPCPASILLLFSKLMVKNDSMSFEWLRIGPLPLPQHTH